MFKKISLFCLLISVFSTQSFAWRFADLQKTTDLTVDYYLPAVKARLLPYFIEAHLDFPPKALSILVFKQERRVELWGKSAGAWVFIRSYPLTAMSGRLGPKRREYDRQIPEGIYKILFLDPFSDYHLSMKINYPNAFDLAQAKKEGRNNLGGDIFIHGNQLSVGCVAVGDVAIEELFVLVALVGIKNTEIIISAKDFRKKYPFYSLSKPLWAHGLDLQIKKALSLYATK